MGTTYFIILLVLSLIFGLNAKVRPEKKDKRKNIVIIIADDLGWNDVSIHGSDQVPTPNIDAVGYAGVTLARYYSHPVCTPSRSALLTGKYAHTMGMQGAPLSNSEDKGLPLSEKLLPQYLKELGYATHLVGKWHVGMAREDFLPTRRGFDSHFGHRGGAIDYYEYVWEENWGYGKFSGLDLYRNDTAAWDVEGYITDLYTEEAKKIIKSHSESQPLFLMLAHVATHCSVNSSTLQAPPEVVRAMRHVESPERRVFAAMTKKLDDSVGEVIEALYKKDILDNTIVVFISDNGGMTSGLTVNYANNYPLRGTKISPFEGGVRVAGALWTPEEISSHFYEGYVHVSDWLPTLLKAVGGKPPKNIDGHDVWKNILSNNNSSRTEIIDIDDLTGFATITSGNFKLVTGTVPVDIGSHQGGDLLGIIGKPPCYIDAIKKSKAYNIFMKMGKVVNIDEVGIRKVLEHQCDDFTEADDIICYPGNGKVCLYDIKNDPCERKDLSAMYPDIVIRMIGRLEEEKKRVIYRSKPLNDPRSTPSLFNYTWSVFIH